MPFSAPTPPAHERATVASPDHGGADVQSSCFPPRRDRDAFDGEATTMSVETGEDSFDVCAETSLEKGCGMDEATKPIASHGAMVPSEQPLNGVNVGGEAALGLEPESAPEPGDFWTSLESPGGSGSVVEELETFGAENWLDVSLAMLPEV